MADPACCWKVSSLKVIDRAHGRGSDSSAALRGVDSDLKWPDRCRRSCERTSVQVDLKSSTSRYSEENLRRGLNERLPCSIRISKLAAVPPTFCAKRSSQKQYSYYFQLGSVALPDLRNITMWNRQDFDHESMHHAAQSLAGKHEFIGFSTAGAHGLCNIREIFEGKVSCSSNLMPGSSDPEDS